MYTDNLGAHIGRASRAKYGNSRIVLPPYRAGLVGYGRCQGDEDRATRNLAPAKVGTVAALVGTPTFDGVYMNSLGALSGIETDLPETGRFTWIWIGKTSATLVGGANQPGVMGNFNGSSGSSLSIINHSVSAFPAARLSGQGYDDGNNLARQNVVNISLPRMVAFRRFDDEIVVNDLTAGLESPPTTLDSAEVIAARNIRIGTTYSGAFGGTSETAGWAIFTDALSDAALVRNYEFEKGYMAQDGIEITI